MEYKVINIDGKTSEELENVLNFYSKDGWYVICDTLCGIVLCRVKVEVQPLVGNNMSFSIKV